MLARTRVPAVAEAEEEPKEQPQHVAVLTQAEVPSRTTSQPQFLAEAEPAMKGTPDERPGRLQTTIVAREEVGPVTWYTIKVQYDGIEKHCSKRYSDFVQFDKFLRKRLPCLQDMLPQLPSSGRVGLRHKLDLGTFNDRRQVGLEGFLNTAVRIADEQPVRRFLLEGRVSGSLSPEYLAKIGTGSAPETKESVHAAGVSARAAVARGGC